MEDNLNNILEIKSKEEFHATTDGFFSFRKMISSTLIKVLYVLGAIAITIGGIAVISKGADSYGGSTTVVLGLGLILLGNLLWRIICEGWILLFSMHDVMIEILKEIKQRNFNLS